MRNNKRNSNNILKIYLKDSNSYFQIITDMIKALAHLPSPVGIMNLMLKS